jgi:hypothetical protein
VPAAGGTEPAKRPGNAMRSVPGAQCQTAAHGTCRGSPFGRYSPIRPTCDDVASTVGDGGSRSREES